MCEQFDYFVWKYTIFRSRTEKKLPTKEKVRKISIAELIDKEKNLADQGWEAAMKFIEMGLLT